jgi:hypothetical protein
MKYEKEEFFRIFLHGYHFGRVEMSHCFLPTPKDKLEKLFYEYLAEKKLDEEKYWRIEKQ